MFIYTGKLKWQRLGVDELLVIALPNGPVRLGDTVYMFSQWTVDSKGNKKVNWFQGQTVRAVKKTDNGEDTIQLSGGWYSYEITTQQTYGKLDFTMLNPNKYTSTMTLDRVYQSQGQPSADVARIWTGKLNWAQYATNEPFMAVVPEGFGQGKPALAFWQLTVDAAGTSKVPCFINAVQKAETGSNQVLKFSFEDVYSLTCTWDEKTSKLAIHMQESDHSEDIGAFDESALISPHSHDLTPPEPFVEKSEVEIRYPQASPSLGRIQTPMPFPRTLVDNLTHVASFVDQAGYLAKYAVERYNALDKSYHARGQQIDAFNSQISELNVTLRQLTDENKLEKDENANLEARLSDARDAAAKKEAELTKQIQDLQKMVSDDSSHDAADHKALEEAHQMAREEQAAKAKLQTQLGETQSALAAAQARVQQSSAQITGLTAQISTINGELDIERAHNGELDKTNLELKRNVSKLESDLAVAQKTIARTTEDLEEAKADGDNKDKVIEGLEVGLVAIKKDRDSKKKALEDLKEKTDAIVNDLEAKIASSTGGWQPPSDSIFPFNQPTPDPLRTSISKNASKASRVRLSPWIGTMSNPGTFFNSLDDMGDNAKLKTLQIYTNDNFITGFSIDWTDGRSGGYGNLVGAPKFSLSQSPDLPIVAVNVVTDDLAPRIPYQPLANIAFFGFDKTTGYRQVDEYTALHGSYGWTKPIAGTSFAPALDGTWALLGVYGYFADGGCIDAVGFVWGLE